MMEVSQLLIPLLLAEALCCALAGLPSLTRGKFLAVEKQSDILVSPDGTFSGGFYKVGDNAYCFSIWFTNSADKAVVWMANRNRPVGGKRSRLTLLRNGNMILTDQDGSVAWTTNTFSAVAVEAQLLNNGNLVLHQQGSKFIWQSFLFPTDTVLPSQPITKNTTLISMRTKGTYFSGFYNFKFDDNNVLHLVYNGPMTASIIWPNTSSTVFVSGRTPYNSSRVAILDESGHFQSSDGLQFNASNYGVGPRRRLTLDHDGTLRLYSLDEHSGSWDTTWFGGADFCRVHGLCGAYGICVYDTKPSCTCPYGFTRADPSDWSQGCAPLFNLTCNAKELDFMELHNTDFYGYDIQSGRALGVTFEQCRNVCLNDCSCQGFGYAIDGLAQCYPKGKLFNGFHMPRSKSNLHIKVPKGFVKSNPELALERTYNLSCSGQETVLISSGMSAEGSKKDEYVKYLIGIVVSVGVFEITCAGLGWWFMFRKHTHDELANLGYMIIAMGFKRFTYKELNRATRNFKQEIGKGGFGTVYKGVLENGTAVAVKRLEGVSQGEAQFWAEVTIIGKINHMNLVKMLGFCVDNEHKILVYEYVENGSLDKVLFSGSGRGLSWEERCNIALGTAKGLAYLHEECMEWVLHCDVKPQNILLDDLLEPKVADFGMSMLFKESNDMGFSKVRGTRGYLAPEWIKNSKIDAKVDVYSYGMVLLELLSGKSAHAFQSAQGPDNSLVHWMRQKIENKEMKEVIDPRLNQEYDKEKLERLVKVAMLCVGEDPGTRPSMSKVVELLSKYDKIE